MRDVRQIFEVTFVEWLLFVETFDIFIDDIDQLVVFAFFAGQFTDLLENFFRILVVFSEAAGSTSPPAP